MTVGREEMNTGAAARTTHGFQRTRLKKTSRGPRGARRLGESEAHPMEAGSSESEHEVDPQSAEIAPKAEEEKVSLQPTGTTTQNVPRATLGRAGRRPGGENSSHEAERPRRQGKELARDQETGFIPARWPSPYCLFLSEDGVWDKASDLLIGTHPSARYEGEPDAVHRYDPAHHMDVRSSVLQSRYVQARAVEQFSLPEDEEFLKKIPDVGLHVILRSYLTRGCLVEREIYSRLAQGHNAYELLRRKHVAPGVSGNNEFDRVVRELSAKQAEIDDWRREMEVKEQTIAELKASSAKKSAKIKELRQRLQDSTGGSGSVDKVYRERDLAMAQVALEKQIAQHAKTQLEQELIAKQQLLGECARLKESLHGVENRVAYLESDDYQSVIIEKGRPKIIEEFRQSTMGKVEVALACKAGTDFIVKQLPAEYQDFPGRLQYPPCVASHVSLFSKLEKAGAGYDVSRCEAEEEEEEAESSADDSSSGADRDVGEGSGERGVDEVLQDPPSIPPLPTNVTLPLTPGADMDLS